MIKSKSQAVTTKTQLLSCGVGSFCNDTINKVMFSFGLVFFTKVADLSNEQAGLVLVGGQVTNFFANFLFGYCCDHVDVPLLSRVHGRRKTWHLIGTIFTVLFFVLSFTRCLLCPEPTSTHSWLGFAYFTATYGIAGFFWGNVDVAHLSFIPETAKTEDEIVILNSIRTSFSYLGGICAYGVAWIFLGRSSDGNLSPDNSLDFTKITATVSGIGLLFVFMFHFGSPETRKGHETPRRKSTIFHAGGVHSASMTFVLDHEGEEVPEEDKLTTRKSSTTNVLRKISTYIVPFHAEMSQDNTPSLRYGVKQSVTSLGDQKPTLTIPRCIEVMEPSSDNIQKRHKIRKAPVYERQSQGITLSRTIITGTTSAEELDQIESDTRSTDIDKWNGSVKISKETDTPVEDYGIRSTHEEIVSSIHATSQIEIEDGRPAAKSVKEWLKDPNLYKVTAIYTTAYSLENLTFSYLALYLIDHLHFEKEATAYLSIVFLVSGIFGCAISKVLDKVVGRMWTFRAATFLAIGIATWFYFVTESTKQMVYAPIVLFGCCVSAMIVMSLSYIGDFVSESEESAGFVFSFVAAIQKVLTGLMLMLIQSFYPTGSGDCQDCGDYVRMVYPLALGFLPLIGLLVTFFSEFPTRYCRGNHRDGQLSETTVISNPLAEHASESSLPDSAEVTEWNTRL